MRFCQSYRFNMDINFLNTILNTHSVSGFENEIREEFLNYTKQFVDSIDTDNTSVRRKILRQCFNY